MHDDDYVRPFDLKHVIGNKIRDYITAMGMNGVMHHSKVKTMVRWDLPNQDFVKVNVDGAKSTHGGAGCGGIIRDAAGVWCGGFAKGLGMCSPLRAELWGILEGLKLVRRLGF